MHMKQFASLIPVELVFSNPWEQLSYTYGISFGNCVLVAYPLSFGDQENADTFVIIFADCKRRKN